MEQSLEGITQKAASSAPQGILFKSFKNKYLYTCIAAKISLYFNFIFLAQSASHVPTQAEREAAIEEMKQKKEALQNASEERKNFMQTMELKRKENAKPSDLEQVNNQQSVEYWDFEQIQWDNTITQAGFLKIDHKDVCIIYAISGGNEAEWHVAGKS